MSNKIICVGRNYADHAKELNNAIPSEPLFFIKPMSCYVPFKDDILIPKHLGSVHFECEIALKIGQPIERHTADMTQAITGVGLALDLTLRDKQTELKQKGHPWERSKAFKHSCPISDFVAIPTEMDWEKMGLEFYKNGQCVQKGASDQWLFSLDQLLQESESVFGLEPGDILLTGTPAGVGELREGDQLQAKCFLADKLFFETTTARVNLLAD